MTWPTDVLIGSTLIPTAGYAYSINGTVYGIATGYYYLYDATDADSILAQLEADLLTEGITNALVFLTEAGYVRITGDVNFTIIWTDSEFRDLLGFTATVGPTQAATASLRSPLIWVPSFPGEPGLSPANIHGTPIYDTAITVSPSGQTSQFNSHNTATHQEWRWAMVPQARVWTTSQAGLGGEFRKFYDEVLRKGRQHKHYTGVEEGTGSTAMAFSGSTLGPYKLRRTLDEWWNRQVPSSDRQTSITLDVQKVAEYA